MTPSITCETIEHSGWPDCRRLSNGALEMLVVTRVGPRVLGLSLPGLSLPGGRNLLKVFDDDLGKTSGTEWAPFGGHRLWAAPEADPRTYALEFEPTTADWDGALLRLRPPVQPECGLRREIDIQLHPTEPEAVLTHRIVNEGPWPVRCAPWALTVMAPGGEAIIPQEPYAPHPEALLSARQLVLWRYTNMADPRWTWGRRLLRLRQDAALPEPQKVGAFVSAGWAAYLIDGLAFVKTFGAESSADYPDRGCNFETFTNDAMLEVESLAPMQTIEPGASSAEHRESWRLQPFDPPKDEEALEDALSSIAAKMR